MPAPCQPKQKYHAISTTPFSITSDAVRARGINAAGLHGMRCLLVMVKRKSLRDMARPSNIENNL